MNDFNSAYAPGRAGTLDTSRDAGLRAFMLGVYNKMAAGLVLSAVLAYAVGAFAPLTQVVLNPPVVYIVQWGPVALLLGSMLFMRNASPLGTAVLYWSVVSLIGLGLGVWVFAALSGTGLQTAAGTQLTVTFALMAKAFAITAAAFAGLSLWGYTTKTNLTGMGSFLIMGTWGLLLVGASNLFFKSPALEMAVQGVGVVLFAGIMAWQTQTLKVAYYQMGGDQRSMAVLTNWGALNLYISFVNMFQFLLAMLGGSRD